MLYQPSFSATTHPRRLGTSSTLHNGRSLFRSPCRLPAHPLRSIIPLRLEDKLLVTLEPHRHTHVALTVSPSLRTKVPWNSLGARPFKHFQVMLEPVKSSLQSFIDHRTAGFECPLTSRQDSLFVVWFRESPRWSCPCSGVEAAHSSFWQRPLRLRRDNAERRVGGAAGRASVTRQEGRPVETGRRLSRSRTT